MGNGESPPVAVTPVEPKFALASKTIGFNLFSFALYALQTVLQAQVLSPSVQLGLNIAGNTLLRFWTSQPISLLPIREK